MEIDYINKILKILLETNDIWFLEQIYCYAVNITKDEEVSMAQGIPQSPEMYQDSLRDSIRDFLKDISNTEDLRMLYGMARAAYRDKKAQEGGK